MNDRRIKCQCGATHSTVAEVRACRGVDAARPSPRVPQSVAASAQRQSEAEQLREQVDPLRCPMCPNAFGRIRPGSNYAVCEDCASTWDTAAPRSAVESQPVWTTESSTSTYHLQRDCTWRIRAQRANEDRGGSPAPLTQMGRLRARSLGKAPCQHCTPRDWID